MPLRYVGTVDEMTPDRIRNLRGRIQRSRNVWDAKAERMDDESGFLVALPAPPSSAPLVPVRWQNAVFGIGGILLGLLVAAAVWWWNKGASRRNRRRVAADS